MSDQEKLPYEAEIKRTYEAATKLAGSSWVTSENAEIRNALQSLRSQARQATQNDPHAQGFLQNLEAQVVGPEGIGLQIQLRAQGRGSRQRGARAKSEEIEDLWQTWGDQRVDAADRFDWAALQRLVIRETAEAGEVLVRMVVLNGELKLEMVECDQLDYLYERPMNKDTGMTWRLGVGLDRWKKRVRYAVLPYHPGDLYYDQLPSRGEHIFVPATEMLQIFRTRRVGQVRGIPWTVSSLVLLAHLRGYEENTAIRARATSGGVAFIKRTEDSLGATLADEEVTDEFGDRQKITHSRPGTYHYLNPGEDITVPDWRAPANEHEMYIRATLRSAATGMGISYESLSGDHSQSNYSSSRMAMLKERDNYRIAQALLIEELLTPVFIRWLDNEVRQGRLSVTPEQRRQLVTGRALAWHPRGWPWVDPSKDVQATVTAVAAGFRSASDVVAEQGRDFQSVVMERQRDKEMLEEAGLPTTVGAAQTTAQPQANENPGNPTATDGQPE